MNARSNKELKLTSVEHIGRSQLNSSVRQTAEMSIRIAAVIRAMHQGLGGHPNPATDGRLKTGHQE